MKEKECATNIIKTVLRNGSTPDAIHDLYEISRGNKNLLLEHIIALKNIFAKAEKQLKKEVNNHQKDIKEW